MCKILLLLTEKSNRVWVAKRCFFRSARESAIHASTPFPSPPEVDTRFFKAAFTTLHGKRSDNRLAAGVFRAAV